MKIASQQIGRGKLGNAIYAQVGGECIARQYQPNVANPSTPAQVEQRAKMKLITQIAASMKSVSAFTRQGLLSASNLFVKKNFGLTSFADDAASIDLLGIQLTPGVELAGALEVSNLKADGFHVELKTTPPASVKRVVYAVYIQYYDRMTLVTSAVVDTAGANGKFPYSFRYIAAAGVVYAYTISDKDERATAKFANYNVTMATQLASLLSSRSLSVSDYTFSATSSHSFDIDDSD